METSEVYEDDFHVNVHIGGPFVISVTGNVTVNVFYEGSSPEPGAAKTATLVLGGQMPGAITVDTTNETATVGFEDDKQNATDAPAGTTVTFASDNEAVATVAVDPSNPLTADITPVGVGSANISASFGGSALEADGTTPIPDPAPAAVTVAAGAADQAEFVLSS